MPQEVKGKLIVRDTLTNGEFTFPHLDGNNNEYLCTDGAGNVTWKNPVAEIDGGLANSTYLPFQLIDGGNA